MTLGGRVFPPGTPRFCWCRFSLHCHRAGREAERPEPGPSGSPASYKHNPQPVMPETGRTCGSVRAAASLHGAAAPTPRCRSPLHVHRGDVEGHALQPQHHEQALREGAVADALAIAPCLGKQNTELSRPVLPASPPRPAEAFKARTGEASASGASNPMSILPTWALVS